MKIIPEYWQARRTKTRVELGQRLPLPLRIERGIRLFTERRLMHWCVGSFVRLFGSSEDMREFDRSLEDTRPLPRQR